MSVGSGCPGEKGGKSAGEGGLFIEMGLSGKPLGTLTSEQRLEEGERGAM